MLTEEGKHSGRACPQPMPRSVMEALEPRLLLSSTAGAALPAPYLPEQFFLSQPGGYLTEAAAGDPLDIAIAYLTDHADRLGLGGQDILQSIVTDHYVSSDTGVTHIYLRQRLNGLEIVNSNISVNITADGRVLNVGGGFVSGLASATAPALTATMTAPAAATLAAAALHLPSTTDFLVTQQSPDPAGAVVLVNAELSLDPIPARLHYVASPQGVALAWDLVMRTADLQHWYDVSVDAETGECLQVSDWVNAATYNVYAGQTESPSDGDRTLVTNPADPAASPLGWHDTGGAEYTDTRGNNVFAQEDADANNTGGFRPDGGQELYFDFALDPASSPYVNRSAAIANLFYWNNFLHDAHYRYGFDEASGNFQMTNYTGLGLGGDAVLADAQDGSSYNNATFATPPDGQSPRMQMYLFTLNTPMRDGALDNQIIIHEYSHGVTNRLLGGPGNANALDARQSKAMSEGWSDWWALMFTLKPTDAKLGAYPFGTYALGQSPDGPGLRQYPRSFDMSIDPVTYGCYNNSRNVYVSSQIWCSALWDMTWLLIDKYGYSETIAHGYAPATPGSDGGNNLAFKLVEDSLKLMPANPSFLDGREALLQADLVLTGGANQSVIWAAFARRGMGLSATDGGGANALFVTEAFDAPSADPVVVSSAPAGPIGVPVSEAAFTFNEPIDPASFTVADDVVSFTGPGGADLKPHITGATWDDPRTLRISFTPQSTPGPYVMTIGPAILSADDGSPMDQDRDGRPGEALGDRYSATFEGVAALYRADMSADPGWTLDAGEAPDQWQYGAPGGNDGDPSSAHTGSSVIGYNLDGNYPDEMETAQYATTTAFSTVGYNDITLGFRQWLGVESSLYDHAGIEVWDGAAWSSVWEHAGGNVSSASWSYVQYILPASANNQPEVKIRWAMGPSDKYVNYCGWNIDDVLVWGTTAGSDIVGPKVTAHSPGPALTGGQGAVRLSFNEMMDTGSFSVAGDVISFTGPAGDLKPQITGYTWLDGQRLEIRFAEQTATGSYTMVIGPGITDNAPGLNPMDQDGDGANGEAGDDRYGVSFTIAAGAPAIYAADMDIDPGWAFDEGTGQYQWQYGPASGVSANPPAAYTGENVTGYNLSGNYQNLMTATQYATTPAFSTVGHTDVTLEFWVWMTVESSVYDHVNIEAWDGTDWITLWYHTGETYTTRSQWSYRQYVLPASTYNQPEVKIRWGMGPTDRFSAYCGWNIDDVLVTGASFGNPRVVGRHVFYNNSLFDGNNPVANAQDDNAIAPPPSLRDPGELGKQLGKQALLPGQTASLVNYTSYSRGINGIMVDVADLAGQGVTADDFAFMVGNSDDLSEWSAAPAPLSVTVRRGAGVGASDRATIIWADDDPLTPQREAGAISKQWLQVTVLSDANGGHLGLAGDDVFYFGNAIGETGDSPTSAKVNATDQLGTRGDIHTASNPAPIHDAYDFDRDGEVNPYSADELIARNNQTTFLTELRLIAAPTPAQAAPAPEMLPGDATMDGRVDNADLRVLRANFGATGATWPQGDFDGDGDVDATDYITLKANLGRSIPAPADAEAPAVTETISSPALSLAETPVAAAMAGLLSDTSFALAVAPPAEPPKAGTWTVTAAAAPTISAIAATASKPQATAGTDLPQPLTVAWLWANLSAEANDRAPADDSLIEPLLGQLRAIPWQDDLRPASLRLQRGGLK